MLKIKITLPLIFSYKNNDYRGPSTFNMNEIDGEEFIKFLKFRSIPFEIEKIENDNIKLTQKKLYSLGLNKDPIDKRDFLFKYVINNSSINDFIDYSSQMSPIKDQGQAGTCVGMAVTAVKEWQEQREYLNEIKSGKRYRRNKPYYDLSEQWTYYKAKEIDGYPDQEGTNIRSALKQVCKLGIPPEKAWPYNDKIKGSPQPWAKMIAKWGKGKSYYRINNLNELLTAIHDHGPCTIGILCFREIFLVGSDGIVKDPVNPNQIYGGHAVVACGYDKNKGLIKFRNSWSKNWGQKGYGYLSFNYINKYMLDAWVLIDQNVVSSDLKNK